MAENDICAGCGRPRFADAVGGLCPECLMKAGFGTGATPRPGEATARAPFAPPPLEELASLFPQLEIVALLGQGGMGAVYQARQPALDRWVALKVLPLQKAATAGFSERFNREARALARLSHPNVVAVHDFGKVDGYFYLVMEYVDGASLRQLFQARKLAPEEALAIVPRICEALQYAHDHGVVHRDIKPENVLLNKDGQVKIADFGIAKIVEGDAPGRSPITRDEQVIGTPHYMAPEQVEHPQRVDHRADIYSLGVVFYEMLTGELPLGKFQPPSSRMRGVQVDVRLDEVVLRALEKEPERRYQQASEVKTAVETIVAAGTAAGPSSAAPARHERTPAGVLAARWTGRVLALIAFLIVLSFILLEGFPPFWKQPLAVKVELVAMLLMLAGFAVGWIREGTGAGLVGGGWVLFGLAEGGLPPAILTAFLVVGILYAYAWWARRRWKSALRGAAVAVLALAFVLGTLFWPRKIYLDGRVLDANTGGPIANAEVKRFSNKHDLSAILATRTSLDGRFSLDMGRYAASTQVQVSAGGYATLQATLGPRAFGQRRIGREYRLTPLRPSETGASQLPPTANGHGSKLATAASPLEQVLATVEREYLGDVERRTLAEAALRAVAGKLDAYSGVGSTQEMALANEEFAPQQGGLGLSIRFDPTNRQVVVVTPLPDTPGFKAGIRAGDCIVEIDGKPVSGFPAGKELMTALAQLRGPPGEAVTLGVKRTGSETVERLKLVRELILLPNVKGDTRKPDGSWNLMLDDTLKIGYVRLIRFGPRSAQEMESALRELEREQIKGLILDLREDSGGSLTQAVRIADLFLDSGLIVRSQQRGAPDQEWFARKEGTFTGFPMAVLVNGATAGASEVLAACLQDHQRAVIVGERTFGKGSVQSLFPLGEGQALRLTTATLYRPNGVKLDRDPDAKGASEGGVTPNDNFEVRLSDEERRQYNAYRDQRDVFRGQGASPGQFRDRVLQRALECVQVIRPLAASLPSGIGIELVALAQYPAKGQAVWRPDGNALPPPMFDDSRTDIRSFQPPGTRPIELMFAIEGLRSGPGCEAAFDLENAFWAGRKFKSGVLQPAIKAVVLQVPTNAPLAHVTLVFNPAEQLRMSTSFETNIPLTDAKTLLPTPLAPGEQAVTFMYFSLRPGYHTFPQAILHDRMR